MDLDGPRIISDIKYPIVMIPRVDPALGDNIKNALVDIQKSELELVNASLEQSHMDDRYHMITVAAPAEASPLGLAQLATVTVSKRLTDLFEEELEGWGQIYYDRVFIKTGDTPDDDEMDEFLDISLEGF